MSSAHKVLCIDLRWIDSSGVGVYIKGIMPGIVAALDQVSVVCLGNSRRLQDFPWARARNVTVVHCTSERYSRAEQIELPKAIPANTDLYFSPYYTIPLLYRGRLIVTVHDMSHLVVPEIVGNFKKRTYARMMYRALVKRASAVLTVSAFSKSEFLRLMSTYPANKVHATHLGVGAEWYEACMLPQRRQRPYFVCVGNVKPYKNLPGLVEAFLKVRDCVPQDLLIVGQSKGLRTGESHSFFSRVAEGGERIELTGYIPDEELVALVAHADGLIMPSLYEGFGLPALEAMAAGTPVIVSRIASLPEVCGDAAAYFDPHDVDDIARQIELVGTQPILRERLAAAGKERSRQFSWDSCARETVSVFQSLLYAPG